MKLFSLIYQGALRKATHKKVIPQEDFDTLLNAQEVLIKAQEDAVAYKESTLKECQELRLRAKEEGFDEGLNRFNEQLVHFEQEIKKIHHDAFQAILPLALKAAKKIVAKELKLHPDTIVGIVLETLAPVTQSHKIKIYVNREEKASLEAERPQLKEVFEHLQTLTILERDDIYPGGCIIETESGIINATIENQWRSLESAFEKYTKR